MSLRMRAVLSTLLAIGILVGTQANAGSAARRSEPHAKVRIDNFKFKPFKLTVTRGTEVTFVNRDSVAHRPAKRGGFDAGLIRPGKAESVRFARRGVYRYICTIHPFMHGKIVVR